MRISKIVIPIALAISLVFAGFTVYAHQAENFVVRINGEDDVRLALSLNEDCSKQTGRLVVPVDGRYEDVTYKPNTQHLYGQRQYSQNLPDDIAKQPCGVHSVYESRNAIAFYSFSFWLINNSDRAVGVDMTMNIDEIVVADPQAEKHIDGAVRIMLVEGTPLLSENTYVVYKKPELNEQNEWLLSHPEEGDPIMYGNTVEFASDRCVFDRSGERGYNLEAKGGKVRFTVVIWLEGVDVECVDEIRRDSLKMSIDFQGY